MSAAPWRLVRDTGPADGPTNMAIDAALLEAVRAGSGPVLRFYRWAPPTLSFGRNQPSAGLYDQATARARGIAFVRRPTGGQAVFHADELTYAVVAPVERIGKPREAYRSINRALVAGLVELGVAARVAGPAPAAGSATAPGAAGAAPVTAVPGPPNWTAACFRDPADGEVVVRGRKLVGSAQRCEGRVILQHGSLLLSGSQAAAEALLVGGTPEAAVGTGRGAPGAAPGWTTVEEELGERPDWSSLAAALESGFARTVGTALAPGALSVEEDRRAKELREHYASREWTWRR